MQSFEILPMEWSRLQDIDDTPPLDSSDMACMDEIRAVLARHGKLDRFALHLAHAHFQLADGEVLIEQTNPASRSQHTIVGKIEDVPDAVPTTWLFIGTGPFKVCPIIDGDKRHLGKQVETDVPPPPLQKEEADMQRRVNRERALYEGGMPVAGHDPHRKHERGR